MGMKLMRVSTVFVSTACLATSGPYGTGPTGWDWGCCDGNTHGKMQKDMFCNLWPYVGLAMARMVDANVPFALNTVRTAFAVFSLHSPKIKNSPIKFSQFAMLTYHKQSKVCPVFMWCSPFFFSHWMEQPPPPLVIATQKSQINTVPTPTVAWTRA